MSGLPVRPTPRPLLFLDIDGVICLGKPYGWHEISSDDELPYDLWQRLWHPPSVSTLKTVIAEFSPRVVMTTSWTSLLQREDFQRIFEETRLDAVVDAFDSKEWRAPQLPGETRNSAIERWLARNRQWLAPKVVLDDRFSGTGLRGSRLDRSGCVVLCEHSVGLQPSDLPRIRAALMR